MLDLDTQKIAPNVDEPQKGSRSLSQKNSASFQQPKKWALPKF